MSVARILVLLAAAAAAVVVWLYVRNSSATTPSETVAAAPAAAAVRVLVASRDLELGASLSAGDLTWREWPDAGVSPLFVTDRDNPQAIETYTAAIVRDAIAQGEPIVARKLIVAGEAGFMAAILEPGMRAVSTEINAETAAGGFILPGDRVDVIASYETEGENGARGRMSSTILENIRVLAIDQSASRSDEEQVKVGATATLELTPRDAERLAHAQGMGDITLALRSIADAAGDPLALPSDPFARARPDTLSVYRYGARTTNALEGAP